MSLFRFVGQAPPSGPSDHEATLFERAQGVSKSGIVEAQLLPQRGPGAGLPLSCHQTQQHGLRRPWADDATGAEEYVGVKLQVLRADELVQIFSETPSQLRPRPVQQSLRSVAAQRPLQTPICRPQQCPRFPRLLQVTDCLIRWSANQGCALGSAKTRLSPEGVSSCVDNSSSPRVNWIPAASRRVCNCGGGGGACNTGPAATRWNPQFFCHRRDLQIGIVDQVDDTPFVLEQCVDDTALPVAAVRVS